MEKEKSENIKKKIEEYVEQDKKEFEIARKDALRCLNGLEHNLDIDLLSDFEGHALTMSNIISGIQCIEELKLKLIEND